jgi:hypothetical protein
MDPSGAFGQRTHLPGLHVHVRGLLVCGGLDRAHVQGQGGGRLAHTNCGVAVHGSVALALVDGV